MCWFLESFSLARLILQLIVFGIFRSQWSKKQLFITAVCSIRLIVSHSKHTVDMSVFLFASTRRPNAQACKGESYWDRKSEMNYFAFSLQPPPLPCLQLTLWAGTATLYFTPHITFKHGVKEKSGSRFTVKVFASYILAFHSFSVMPLQNCRPCP